MLGKLRFILWGLVLVAAAALAFIVQLLVPDLTSAGAGAVQIVLFATADVFLVATMLSLLPRVVPQLRRYLVLTSCGMV
ncbi:MAG: hypothetical protein H0X53_07910, partial [Sphingomonas sp.]|nr:hypothetical protein [Sphingomonas sp.]